MHSSSLAPETKLRSPVSSPAPPVQLSAISFLFFLGLCRLRCEFLLFELGFMSGSFSLVVETDTCPMIIAMLLRVLGWVTDY